jgi:phosphate transport system protein
MSRVVLDQKINSLINDVLILESHVRKAILDSVNSLQKRDFIASTDIYFRDERINQYRFQIETETLAVIATQQPMAKDLRVLSSIIEVSTELERIGDYAKGIAKINLLIGEQPLVVSVSELTEMASLAANMLSKAVRAFSEQDETVSREIPNEDDHVDAYFNRINQNLIENMLRDPSCIEQANYLQWVAHNLERTADRVSNICGRTLFLVTGEMHELEPPDTELVFS